MSEMSLGKIEQIKMLRFGSNSEMGLVEAKFAVEAFDRAQGLVGGKITTIAELYNFVHFAGLIQNGIIEIDTTSGKAVLVKPKVLTDQELYGMIKSF